MKQQDELLKSLSVIDKAIRDYYSILMQREAEKLDALIMDEAAQPAVQRTAECVCVEPLDHPYDEKYCGACGKRRR